MQDDTQDKVLVSSRDTQLVGRTCSGGATWPGVHLLPSRFSGSTCTHSLSEGTVAEQIFGSDPQDHSLHVLCPLSSESEDVQDLMCTVMTDRACANVRTLTHTAPSHRDIRCPNVNHFLIIKLLQYRSQRKLLWHLMTINPRDGGSV